MRIQLQGIIWCVDTMLPTINRIQIVNSMHSFQGIQDLRSLRNIFSFFIIQFCALQGVVVWRIPKDSTYPQNIICTWKLHDALKGDLWGLYLQLNYSIYTSNAAGSNLNQLNLNYSTRSISIVSISIICTVNLSFD